MGEIILYTTYCPKCKVLEAKLKERGFDYYTNNNIDIMQKKGFLSAPMLDIGDKILTFEEAIKWLKEV